MTEKYSTLVDVQNKWREDVAFREDWKKNPEQALKKHGLKLTPEDLNKIKPLFNIEKSKNTNEKLDPRISK